MPLDRGARIHALKQRYKERQLQRAERWSNWKAGVVEEMMSLQIHTREKLLTRFTDTKLMIELVTDRISETTLELKASVNSACTKASDMVDNVVDGFSSDVQKASDSLEEIGESIHAHGAVSAELTQNQVADLSDDIHENLNSLRRNFKDFSLHESFCDAIEPRDKPGTPQKNLLQRISTSNVLLRVPSIDSNQCSYLFSGAKASFPGGRGTCIFSLRPKP
eukprot:sb/3469788/